MEIKYKNRDIERVCTNVSVATRKYGVQMMQKIFKRIQEIYSSDSVEMMIQYQIGRCHPLHQNRKNQYALDLVQPYRLIFEKKETEIQTVNIIEITNYH